MKLRAGGAACCGGVGVSVATALVFAVAAVSAQPLARPASGYSVVDLGANRVPRAINAYGQVLLNHLEDFGTGKYSVEVWTPAAENGSSGSVVKLGYGLSGAVTANSYGLNDAGQLVGVSWFAEEDGHGFLWQPASSHSSSGTFVDLGRGVIALGINAGGTIVGCSREVPNGNCVAFFWRPTAPNGTVGVFSRVPLPPGHPGSVGSVCTLVAADGVAACWADADRPFLSDGLTSVELPRLSASHTEAHASSNSGIFAGFSYTPVGVHAVKWSRGGGLSASITDLGVLSGYAYGDGVNDGGAVVGTSAGTERDRQFAVSGPVGFYYTTTTGMIDLNSLVSKRYRVSIMSATGINDAGLIVGTGVYAGERAVPAYGYGLLIIPSGN